MYLTRCTITGFRSRGTGEHDQVHGMLERTIDSLYTVLHTRDFSTCSNCNAFRNISWYTPERGIHSQSKSMKNRRNILVM